MNLYAQSSHLVDDEFFKKKCNWLFCNPIKYWGIGLNSDIFVVSG